MYESHWWRDLHIVLGGNFEDDPSGVSTVEGETCEDEIKSAHIFMGWNV